MPLFAKKIHVNLSNKLFFGSSIKHKRPTDNYTQTHNVLAVYKTFVTKKMDEDFDLNKTDKIDLLNRSIKYFKTNDHFNLDDFAMKSLVTSRALRCLMLTKYNMSKTLTLRYKTILPYIIWP